MLKTTDRDTEIDRPAIHGRSRQEKDFAAQIGKDGKFVDAGFPHDKPAYIDLKIRGTYYKVTVEYKQYKMSLVFRGAGLYEREFHLESVLLMGCTVEVGPKRIYITDCNGKRFYKLATNKSLKVHYDRNFTPRLLPPRASPQT